jgi:hypothetical protein
MVLLGNNQLHGKYFENLVKYSYIGEKDDHIHPLDAFDINACKETGSVPISIKMTKTNTVGLADACRIFSMDTDFRMIVAKYKQDGEMKVVTNIYEFNIKKEEWDAMKGDIPIELVCEFRKCIKMFPENKHPNARRYAKSSCDFIKKNFSYKIQLNPKIDSKKQRRLQCSITLNDLKQSVENWYCYNQYSTGSYRGIVLPFSFFSPKRKLKNTKGVVA